MKANVERRKSQAVVLKEMVSLNEADTSKLREFFATFLALEEKTKALNCDKAELFGNTKAAGFDRRALQAAFRHRVREMEKPEATAAHDELTDSYLIALRSSNGAGSLQAVQSLAPAEVPPAPHARSRPRARETADMPDGRPALLNDRAASSSVIEDEPDIPDFLDTRKASKQPVLANGGK